MTVDPIYLDVDPNFVEFTTSGVPQTVTVTAIDNSIVETALVPYQSYIEPISFSITSTDADYAALVIGDASVTIGENDCGARGYDPMDDNEDCWITIEDLKAFAGKWLECYFPYVTGCPGEGA